MRNDEWLKVEELLNAALELEPGARQQFLAEAGADAPELLREVESLLACEAGAGGFLDAPALALSADFFDDAAEDRTGQTVSHYRIIREVGRGGMGAVYLAERADGEFQQQVALKVVRRSFADSELARRFRRERQILASLNHPNIARLLDGGVSADGEPFIAMEYVEGARVDDYCDDVNLSTDARLRLFLAVCQGVSYAHQHLIIHRDIKPSNILVTTEGVPKLLDFGIAKLLDPEYAGADEHTRTEMRAFTPDYASPEQLAGAPVTTASDVYSLGVLLDHLLRGARANSNARRSPGGWRSRSAGGTVATNLPTDGDGRDGGPKSSTQIFVNSELKNIVAMARREDPARRYSSVVQFAEDVQRYLDGLPIRAQKDSFTYRAGKFVRRNRAGVAAAALVALALVVGLALALWQANVARRERDRAERRFGDVRRLSNALLTDIAPKIERLQGATEARQALVTQSLTYLDSLANEAGDDPALQSELATAYEKVGDLQGNPTNPNLNALADSILSYEKANVMRRALVEKSPRDFEQRRLLANNYRTLGDIRSQAGEKEASNGNTETAARLYAELLAEQPASFEVRLGLARTSQDFGTSLAADEKHAQAIAYFRKAVDLSEELRAQAPERVEVLTLLADGRRRVGNSLSWDNRQKEAEAEMAQAITIYESLVAEHPDDARLLTGLYQTYMMTSSVYEEQDDALSNEYAFKALKLIERAVERDPADLRAKQQLAKTFSRLGVTLENTGQTGESVLYLGKAAQILQELVRHETMSRRFKRDLASAFIRLGDARRRQREFQPALQDLERAAAILTELQEIDATDNGSLRNLANARDSAAGIYEDLAAQARGEKLQAYRRAAAQNYREALTILRQLEARGALSKYDRKSLEGLQSTLQKYEREE